MDRLTAKATPEGTLNYTFDVAGHVASIASSNPNGASMSYSYDNLGHLISVADNRRNGATTTYAYDNASNVATVTYPNGVQSTFAYDALSRVMALHSQPASYAYQRGPTGSLVSTSESSGRAVNWSYDGIYRLTNETINLAPSKNNGTVNYGLDPVGNRLSELSSLTNISSGSWNYNPDDELSSETYDANGNVTSAGGKTFSYDTENHLVSMNGNAVQVLYDAFGNRVAKSANGVITRYLVEDDVNPTGLPQVLEELNSAGGVTRTYTYGLQRISEDQIVDNAWTPSFYGYDGMGNVRQLTSISGTVTDSYEYDAFGNSFTVSGTTPNNYLYRGEQWDPDLNLYYLRARYYNPLTGRFLSRDRNAGKLLDPKSLHKYVYADGDPVNVKDPNGRDAILEFELIVYFTAYRVTPAVVSTEITACALIEATDLALDFYDTAESAFTGQLPEPEPDLATFSRKLTEPAWGMRSERFNWHDHSKYRASYTDFAKLMRMGQELGRKEANELCL